MDDDVREDDRGRDGGGDVREDGPDRDPGRDGDDDVPWAMQLALLDDRRDPEARPSHLAVCEAAAAAVVLLLTDPRAVEGDWAAPVRYWTDGRIRKVVRRGRVTAFAATAELDHVDVTRRGATVRAFVPGPVDGVPKVLAKLQVGGTEQPSVGDPADPVPGGIEIALTPQVAMSTGKAAAQSGHAAQLALGAMPADRLAAWRASGWAVRARVATAEEWPGLLAAAGVVVQDGGFTEVPPGTTTALAWWPSGCQGDR